jgi:MscS family membrane protein
MSLLRENRSGMSKSFVPTRALKIALAALSFLSAAAYSAAQLPKFAAKPATNGEPSATTDPLGRETPRGAVMGFLKYGARQDFAIAARYLQLTPGQETNFSELARELQALHTRFKSNISLLSDDPNGTVEDGLPPGHVRAGVLAVGGSTTDVILVRVDDPVAGKIWLISKETVARIPELYAQMESEGPTAADRIMPAALTGHRVLGMSLAQWLGWLLSIPISWLMAWLLTFLLGAPRRVWCRLRRVPFRTIWDTPFGMPLKCIMAILLHSLFVYLLEPPLLYRVYYSRFMAALLLGCLAWLGSRVTDRGFDLALNRTRTQRRGGESILILMQRLIRVVTLISVLVAALAIFGLNVKTALAGLGIGGLAIALAAQKTLENLIGGVSLLMDKAIQVGDFCQIGGRLGTVEDIGLRSLKLRTVDQNLLVIPNGSLAQMQFENMMNRRKLLLHQNFSLRIETQAEQLRFVLDRAQSMLDKHPEIESGSSRIRVAGFAGASFDLELFAYSKTGNSAEFTAIRQDVILKIADIVEAAGTRLAAPTQLMYVSRDAGIDAEKANGIVRPVTQLRASDDFRFPGQGRTGTK